MGPDAIRRAPYLFGALFTFNILPYRLPIHRCLWFTSAPLLWAFLLAASAGSVLPHRYTVLWTYQRVYGGLACVNHHDARAAGTTTAATKDDRTTSISRDCGVADAEGVVGRPFCGTSAWRPP